MAGVRLPKTCDICLALSSLPTRPSSSRAGPSQTRPFTTSTPRPWRPLMEQGRFKRLIRDHDPNNEIILNHRRYAVINKPAGTAMQGLPAGTGRMFWDAVKADAKTRLRVGRLEPCHRLDKSVSGALLLAKDKLGSKEIMTQLQKGLVRKSYVALVSGVPDVDEMTREANAFEDGEENLGMNVTQSWFNVRTTSGDIVRIWEKPNPELIEERKIIKWVKTCWKLLATNGKYSLLLLNPVTGRKHQLRATCKDIFNSPIVGDFKYGFEADDISQGLDDDRILLHSYELSFYVYSIEGNRLPIHVKCPPGRDFIEACEKAGPEISTALEGLMGTEVDIGKIEDVEEKLGNFKEQRRPLKKARKKERIRIRREKMARMGEPKMGEAGASQVGAGAPVSGSFVGTQMEGTATIRTEVL